MIRLLINTATTNEGGSAQVALSFLNECCKRKDISVGLIATQQFLRLKEGSPFLENVTIYEIHDRPGKNPLLSFANRIFSTYEKAFNPDVVFTTSGPSYWKPSAPHLVGYNLPHYVYPESPFFRTLSLKEKVIWNLRGKAKLWFYNKEADSIVVQTQDVADRLRKILPAKTIHVVSNSCGSQYFHNKNLSRILPDKIDDFELRFFLFSAYYPHKNIEIINHIIPLLPSHIAKHIKFILTIDERTFQTVIDKQHKNTVLNVGKVHPADGPGLYNEVDSVFLPTLLECFSATYVEAMAMRKPILTSDLGFAKTVCDDAALYFDPTDPSDIASKIVQLYESKQLQMELIAKGSTRLLYFDTAEERARKYLEICKSLVDITARA